MSAMGQFATLGTTSDNGCVEPFLPFNDFSAGHALSKLGDDDRRRSARTSPPYTTNLNASPSRTTRPAVGAAKCVPITSVGVPASFANISRRVRVDAAWS